jgi:signal transduction histidine kinase
MKIATARKQRDRAADRWRHRRLGGLNQHAVAFRKAREVDSLATDDDVRSLNRQLEQRLAERTREVQQRVAQLRAMAVEMTLCEQREQTRLAHVLHDELQQLLVAARMKVSLLRRGIDDEQLGQTVRQLDDLLSQSIDESRSLAVALSPPTLHRDGLVSALQWLADEMWQKHGLTAIVEVEPDAEPAPEALRAFLFQAVREMLFNVVKHAQTNRAGVKIAKAGEDQIVIEVIDSGVGFETGNQAACAEADGFGVASIQQRLRFLGGHLEVSSAPGKGTRMVMRAPLHDLGQTTSPGAVGTFRAASPACLKPLHSMKWRANQAPGRSEGSPQRRRPRSPNSLTSATYLQ